MEVELVEKSKSRVRFEIKGEGHTFCNALRKELWQGKSVEIAGYTIEHSLVSEPEFIVETDKGDPKELILSAVKRLKKRNSDLMTAFKKI